MKAVFLSLFAVSSSAMANIDRAGNVIQDGAGGSSMGWLSALLVIGVAGYLAYQQGQAATRARSEAYDAYQEIKRLRSELDLHRALQKTVASHLDGETTDDEFFPIALTQIEAIAANQKANESP